MDNHCTKETLDLVISTKEILNGKLHFLCSEFHGMVIFGNY